MSNNILYVIRIRECMNFFSAREKNLKQTSSNPREYNLKNNK